MNTRRVIFGVMVVCLACLLTAGCQPRDVSTSEETTVSLRLKWIFDPGFAGEMVAAKAGFFKELGLNVDLLPGGFESDPIKLVASGSDTFGVAGADSFLLARSKGVPIVAFAAGYLQTPVVFYSLSQSGITTPRDFVGRRVGYQAGQDTATVYEALLRETGVERSQVREVPVQFNFTPFLTGQVDVWPGYAATQSYILEREKMAYTLIEPATYGIFYLGTVYFARADYLEAHPDLATSFLKGLIKGWEYTYSNYDEAIPMISSYDQKNLTEDLVRFNLDKQRGSILPPGFDRYAQFNEEQWRDLDAILLSQGLIERSAIGGAYTMSILGKAYSGSGDVRQQ